MSDDFVLDLVNYRDRVGTRVTPGRYRVYVEDAELDQTSKGDPMINLWFLVQGGEFDGATVIDRLLPAHPKALFRIVGFMQAVGLPTPKKRMKLNTKAFVGKTLMVDIEDGDPYQGRIKSEVRGYFRSETQNGAPAREVKDQSLGLFDDVEELEVPAAVPAADAESEHRAGGPDADAEKATEDDGDVDLSDLDLS